MGYKLLNGVVFARVCNQNILVATKAAWGKCPYTKRLSALRGAFWQGLELNMSEDEIVEELIVKTTIKEEVIRRLFNRFIEDLKKDGYLISEERDTC